jgi:alpha-beta hydrolase superfamily lysophospholipase
MRWSIVGLAALILTGGAGAADESSPPPPAWMVRGFEAAIADPEAEAAAIQLSYADWLLQAIPEVPNPKLIGKLLPLLESANSDVQAAAARALAAIPPSDPAKAKEVIGKLLPLLESSHRDVQAAAALALAAMGEIEKPARQKRIPKLVPIYVIAGTRDPVSANSKGLEQLLSAYHAAGLQRVTCRFYPEARHELFNETNRDEGAGWSRATARAHRRERCRLN